jgi:hypothetical protein
MTKGLFLRIFKGLQLITIFAVLADCLHNRNLIQIFLITVMVNTDIKSGNDQIPIKDERSYKIKFPTWLDEMDSYTKTNMHE